MYFPPSFFFFSFLVILIPHLIRERDEKSILINIFSIFSCKQKRNKKQESDYLTFLTFPKKQLQSRTFTFKVMPRAPDSQHSEAMCLFRTQGASMAYMQPGGS